MILVTGATGLVGAHLLYKLTTENERVRAIYRTEEKIKEVKKVFAFYTSEWSLFFSKIEWVQADITNIPKLNIAFKGITYVYHCAALVSFNPKDYRKLRKVNIEGTANVVNLAIDAKVKKCCFISSIATLGDAINKAVITEENQWNDGIENSGYAITKHGAEMEVWRASQEGLPVVIVNPGVILGSGFWHTSSSKIISQVANGFNFYTYGVTGFVGVQDVVNAMVLLMNSTIKNERFIVVSENKSFQEIFFLIADNLGKKRPDIHIKPWQTGLFWRLNSLVAIVSKKPPLLTKHTAKAAHTISKYSSEKIKNALSFQFEKIPSLLKKIIKNYPL